MTLPASGGGPPRFAWPGAMPATAPVLLPAAAIAVRRGRSDVSALALHSHALTRCLGRPLSSGNRLEALPGSDGGRAALLHAVESARAQPPACASIC